MKLQNRRFEFSLDAKGIDECSEIIRRSLSSLKIAKRDVIRYAMSIEEILIKNMENATGESFILNVGTRFFRPFVSVSIIGGMYNIYAAKRAENGVYGESILKSLGLSPEYVYSYDRNIYTFRIKKKQLSTFVSLLIALCAAVAVGAVGLLLPESVRSILSEIVFDPLHNAFLNVLGSIAGPMVFLSVAWGIYGVGDTSSLKRIGKNMLFGYTGTVFIVAAAFGLLCLPIFRPDFSNQLGGTSELSGIISMLLGIIPQNIFSPFIDGNTLQIIFLAIVFGVAMLFLGQKTTAVATAVEQINYIVQFLIEFISRLVPYFIFIVLLSMIWSDTVGILIRMAKLFAVFVASVLIMSTVIICYTAIRNRVRPRDLIRKAFPSLLIAMTTASSAAAFGSNMNICKNEFGIDDSISSFGIPLGIVAFKPTTALNYLTLVLAFTEIYGVKVSAAWVVIMILTAVILALATPPIPGGSMTAYTVLFAQLGIPPEAIAIALATDVLFDFIDTGFDQFLLPMMLLNQAERLGMVDRKILKKNKR